MKLKENQFDIIAIGIESVHTIVLEMLFKSIKVLCIYEGACTMISTISYRKRHKFPIQCTLCGLNIYCSFPQKDMESTSKKILASFIPIY